ncbi:hypothetical protein RAMDARK_0009 [Rickettsia amblyommatis str. Darkwater]|nr:hypothetical protein RAMDARK_0009 [Rickettsia amblyommatis str. Darkwater]
MVTSRGLTTGSKKHLKRLDLAIKLARMTLKITGFPLLARNDISNILLIYNLNKHKEC